MCLETFSTESQDEDSKLEFWNEVVCDTLAPVVVDPANPATFSGTLTRKHIGALLLVDVCSDAAVIRHAHAQLARTKDLAYFLLVQLEGTSQHRQDERQTKLNPGDFTLCSSVRPFEITLPTRSRRLVVSIPDGLLRRYFACPDNVVAVRMAGGRGMNALLANFVRSLWTCGAMDHVVATRMSYTLLDLIAAAYSSTSSGGDAEVVLGRHD